MEACRMSPPFRKKDDFSSGAQLQEALEVSNKKNNNRIYCKEDKLVAFLLNSFGSKQVCTPYVLYYAN